MLNDYIATLRPSSSQHHLRPQRLCSCCKEPGHTILYCDDPRIDGLYLESRRIFEQYSDNYYMAYLEIVDLNVINALCLRLGMARTLSFIATRNKGYTLLMTYFTRIRMEEAANMVVIPFNNEIPNEIPNELTDSSIRFRVDVTISPSDFMEECSCPSCYTTDSDKLIKYTCNHYMCGDCFVGTVNAMPRLKYPTCALCRQTITSFRIKTEETYKQIIDEIKNNPRT